MNYGSRRTYLFPFLIAIFFIVASGMYGQTSNFSNYSLEMGLSQSQANCIKEDSRGYLWIGTSGGRLNQFDGVRFKVYEEKNGLAGNIVSSVEEDVESNMWIGTTWGGVSKFDGTTFKTFTVENGLLSNGVIAVCRGKERKMLVATQHGMNVIEDKNVSALNNDLFANVSIYSLYRDNQDNVWIITDKALFLYNGYNIINIQQLYKFNFTVTAITQDKNGNLWLGTNGQGLYILNKTVEEKYVLTPYNKNNELNKLNIHSLLFDKQNQLWMCTYGSGVVKYDYKELVFYNKGTDFSGNTILSVCEDRFGNVWFGTSGMGLIKYSPSTFSYFDNLEGFNSNHVFAIMCDSNKNTWCSAVGIGVFKYDNKTLTKYSTENGLSSNSARALLQDSSGTVWIGTTQGLDYVKGNKISHFELPVKNANIRVMLKDKKGNLWIGTYGDGLIRYDGKTTEIFTEKNGLNYNYIHSLLEDSKGNIWIGTGNGVNKYSLGKMEDFKLASGFCNTYIGCMTEDKTGNIWFGTDRCITRYNGLEFKSFTEADGLTSNTIYLITCDNAGNLWVGTNKGVDKISLKSNGDFNLVTNYGIHEGFKGLECNSRAVTKDRDGNLYFGTIKGVIKYLPRLDKEVVVKPALHITGIKLFSQETSWKEYSGNLTPWFGLPAQLALPYDKNNISFDFVAINLYSPEKIKYQYKLLGFDNEWIPSNTHTATYTNLSPGNYVLQIKAYADNKENAELVEYKFTINKPFWKSWWFILIAAIGLTAVSYLVLRIRTQRVQLANQRLENQVELRTREINKQKQEIETLFKEIHHRVKNNLQVINSLINLQSSFIEDEKTLAIFRECQNRIYTMAVLHEKLYSNHDLTKLELQPYVTKLTGYLNEVYLLDKPVQFDIKINVNNIGIDTIIPIGLLINEIVSNSLKYAFGKEEHPEIRIHIDSLGAKKHRMLIGDNGKGHPVDINAEQHTFGMELIKILVEQLNGKITKLPGKGTVYEIDFESIDKSINKAP